MFEKLFGKKESFEEKADKNNERKLSLTEDGLVESDKLKELDKGFKEKRGDDSWREQK